ncbi:MAG: hypothetical protein N3A53_08645 [Verrucomicrobiae bacterium]|nr:hypothetical protein [Verrucomicrobiae bacterium]
MVELQAIDLAAGMDLSTVKAAVGHRLCLCGNLDCGLLLTGTPEQNYAAARDRLLIGKPGGAYVFGASNAVQPNLSLENHEAIIAAWRAHAPTIDRHRSSWCGLGLRGLIGAVSADSSSGASARTSALHAGWLVL